MKIKDKQKFYKICLNLSFEYNIYNIVLLPLKANVTMPT